MDGDIRRRFEFHPATTKTKQNAHECIRESCKGLAEFLDETVPDSREKSLAITKLEEVMFWANAAIARRATIRVNGVEHQVPKGVQATYDDIVSLTDLPYREDYTVTACHREGWGASLYHTPLGVQPVYVLVTDGMNFDVVHTGNA